MIIKLDNITPQTRDNWKKKSYEIIKLLGWKKMVKICFDKKLKYNILKHLQALVYVLQCLEIYSFTDSKTSVSTSYIEILSS